MKKNNALMLSYIIFLVVTIIAERSFKWNNLDQIAMAATVSGVLFAIADYFGWKSTFEKNICIKFREMINSLLEYPKLMIDALDRQDRDITEIVKSLKPYGQNEEIRLSIEALEEILSQNAECKQEQGKRLLTRKDQYSKLDKFLKSSKRDQKVEGIFGIIGFLSFFIVLAFDYVVLIITPYQSIATVFAFAMIMLNYYMKDVYQTMKEQEFFELKQEIDECKQKAKEYCEHAENHYREIKQKIEELELTARTA